MFHVKHIESEKTGNLFHGKQLEKIIEKSKDYFDLYAAEIQKWQPSLNLISKKTLPDMQKRHILDSAQLFPLIPQQAKRVVDVGSGAGFPGIVLAIMSKIAKNAVQEVILIESDTKKSIFLQEVIRKLELPARVMNDRMERVRLDDVDVLTARALAETQQILEWGRRLISPRTTCLLLKGEKGNDEISKIHFPCSVEKMESLTDSKGCILRITEVLYPDKM